MAWNEGTITSSSASGAADATGDYARAGGLVGFNFGTITSSYFDYETSGRAMDEDLRSKHRRPPVTDGLHGPLRHLEHRP